VFTARYVLHITFCPHSVFMCFVWVWEQTAIISLYSINWLVGFYNWDGVCLLRGTFYILRSAHTVYLCVSVDLRTNSHYFTVQHWLVGFYNWDGVCLLHGTDWNCIIRVSIKLGHIMAQAVVCQPLTAEVPFDICRARSGSGKTFLRVFLFSTNVACLLWLVSKHKRTNTGDVSENNVCSEIGEHCLESTCFHRLFRQVN
jgi:hypothetical protein